jgi:hypothetical protein
MYFLFFCGKNCFCFQKMNMFLIFFIRKEKLKRKNTEKKGLILLNTPSISSLLTVLLCMKNFPASIFQKCHRLHTSPRRQLEAPLFTHGSMLSVFHARQPCLRLRQLRKVPYCFCPLIMELSST